MRHQAHAQNLGSAIAHLINTPRELDSASFPTASGVDLRLDDPYRAADRLCGPDGFVDVECHLANGDGHIVLFQNLFGLVFMNLHRVSS